MSTRVGKYELSERLGKGSFGEVYLATDTFFKTRVALKIIDPVIFKDPERREGARSQFLTEAALVGQLSHPHLVSILDAVVTDTSGYVAMEYVPGGNLSVFSRAESLLSVEDAIEVVFKCCGALDYAFRQGIVHRDLKPANILVVKGTEIKITDFGAAYLKRQDASKTLNIGTPAYMSPDQISGAQLTFQSDMFSLGVVLYELLTGQKPFVAKSIPALMSEILNVNPAPPSRLRSGVAPELDRIVSVALRKRPEDRYQNWADFALDLAAVGGASVYHRSIAESEKYKALRELKALDDFPDPEIWEMVRAGGWTRRPAQSVIMREGEAGTTVFIVAAGEVKVTKQGRLLNVLGRGECVGEMSFVRSGELPRQATVESMTQVLLAEFEEGALEYVSDRCKLRFLHLLSRALVDRLALANTRIVHTVT